MVLPEVATAPFLAAGQLFRLPGQGCGSLDVTFTLLEARLLKPHEELLPELLEETRKAIEEDGFVKEPILAERTHYIILDGHHRHGALLELGARWVPVFLVDYDDEDIRVETWPDAVVDHVTKEEIVETVLAGKRFPPKTTRHIVDLPDRGARVNLKSLRENES
ncbi:MAG: ParB N-terminal domain-containing protein [Thermoplasmata archaeon]